VTNDNGPPARIPAAVLLILSTTSDLSGFKGNQRLTDLSDFSLRNLCVLCVSVVSFYPEFINHRDTEDTEVAQRKPRSRLLCKAVRDLLEANEWLRHRSEGELTFVVLLIRAHSL